MFIGIVFSVKIMTGPFNFLSEASARFSDNVIVDSLNKDSI